jgi:4-alpha-glucanotransferase
MNGRWVKGPGAALVPRGRGADWNCDRRGESRRHHSEVEAIRQQFGYPGMSVLQFAFGSDQQAPSFRPHNYPREVAAYTGTHDNDTTLGWWNSKPGADSTRTAPEIAAERDFARRYLCADGRDMNWVFIQAIMASVADTVLIPLQDVLVPGQRSTDEPAPAGQTAINGACHPVHHPPSRGQQIAGECTTVEVPPCRDRN